ncbi:MAG: flagellin lysine-N-methylase [Lachnospiraceae bacterium]|nr:flagellin lysine-N-methylase [Lachnospiraceae bacterium]
MKKKLYDKFKCRADGCTFTCCNGWEICLDSAECQERTGIPDYIVACDEVCPFECENGLCSIVMECGDDGLPEICDMFPRLINEFDNYEEYSLSFGCPYVLDMVKQDKDLYGCGDVSEFDEKELYIRENIINIIKENDRLDEALLTVWLYLSGNSSEKADETGHTEYYEEAALYELNDLFQDLTVNYLEVQKYKSELIDIWDCSSESDMCELVQQWKEFKKNFEEWDNLLRYCIAEKIYFACVNDNMPDMAEELQIVITEYVMIRFSCFLQCVMNHQSEIFYEDVRKYVTIYSRILGHNSDSVKEFFTDMFGRNIWETDYAFMIIV